MVRRNDVRPRQVTPRARPIAPPMPGSFRGFAALAFAGGCAVLPLVSSADDPTPASGAMGLNFVAPKGWTDETRPNGRPGVWRDWIVRDKTASPAPGS